MALIRENVTLAPLTYYKIGGPARYFAQPESTHELAAVADFLRDRKIPYFVLGAGSNVLLADEGFGGLVLSTAKLDRTLAAHGDELEVGASVMVIHLLRHCMSEGLAGFELLVGIPGNLGGVLCMNAGTRLGEIESTILAITAYDLATKTERTVLRERMKYSYRAQHFLKPDEIIVRARLKGRKADPASVQTQVQALLTSRKTSQPIDRPSCGSVFKNPDPGKNLQAWKVIADIGLRGHRIGNAQISELHTNFIVNLGGAKAADVKALIELAKSRAKAQCDVILEEEVRIVPPDGGKVLGT
ncbi:MAG: UDP-N-acetylmuramate dehydrogenase [Deltaproteobacteria bacterium]|nr:UDP-N-acetylmuramate dehydrogenase [Deltaproteobacteria bacterium]